MKKEQRSQGRFLLFSSVLSGCRNKDAAVLDKGRSFGCDEARGPSPAADKQSLMRFKVSRGGMLYLALNNTCGRRCHEHEAGLAAIFQGKGPDDEAAGKVELQAGDIVRPDGSKGEVSTGSFRKPEIFAQKSACESAPAAVGADKDRLGVSHPQQVFAAEPCVTPKILGIVRRRVADDAHPGELLFIVESQKDMTGSLDDRDIEVSIVDGEHVAAGKSRFNGLFKGDEGRDIREIG